MPASNAQQALTAKRRAQMINLRLAGMDFETISERLEYASAHAASRDFHRAFQANRLEEKEAVETLRNVEGARLDRLQAAVWPKALKGDLKAVETVRRLIAERIRLFGVAEPLRTEVSGPGGGPVQLGPVTAAELDALIGAAGDPDETEDEAVSGDRDGADDDDN